MEISTDLVIKVVALLTAIVGLYKAANMKIAEPFIVHLFAGLSILVVPGAMLGFLWISNAMTKVMERPRANVSYTGQDAEVMYQISREFWNQQMRQEALKFTIERAFATKNWSAIVRASEDLANPSSRRLWAVRVISRAGNPGGGRAPMISS
jgi:hypothetical protein